VLDPKIEPHINGVVLTSPAVRVQPSHPIVAVSICVLHYNSRMSILNVLL